MRTIWMKIKWRGAERKLRRELRNQGWSGMRGQEMSTNSTDIR